MAPIANHDDNRHSFNENLRLRNLWDGIELMAALLTMRTAAAFAFSARRTLASRSCSRHHTDDSNFTMNR